MNEEEIEQKFVELMQICEDLGWSVSIPKLKDDNSEVPGLIIGTRGYINLITENLPDDLDFDDVESYEEALETNEDLH